MRRREFLGVLFGTAAACPRDASLAQQAQQMRRVGVLMPWIAGKPEPEARLVAFMQGLQEAGWAVGRNLRIDTRWAAGEPELFRRYAAEIVALTPNAIFAPITRSAQALREITRTIPIVFASAIDPVGGGLVASLSRPGGNVTGFAAREFGLSGKSLELLKELFPRLARVAVLRDTTSTGGAGQWSAVQTVAPAFGVELTSVDMRDGGEIERALASFAGMANGGLIVTTSLGVEKHHELIISLAAKHRLPAIYSNRDYVTTGSGLIFYGPNLLEQYRRAAGYVDRILRGEKPGDLPVQVPTKYDLVINLRTAKALGLTVPPTLLARANEVIE